MRKTTLVLTTLTLLAAVRPSAAQDVDADCQAIRDRGRDAYEHEDFGAALEYFERAYQLCPTPKWLFNLALALDGLGRDAEALEKYDAALADAPDADVDTRAFARERVVELSKRVGTLVVTSSAPGAEISVDGQVRGAAPLPRALRVAPGRHRVAATLAGHRPFQVDIEVAAGETRTVVTELAVVEAKPAPSPPAAAPPAHPGRSLRIAGVLTAVGGVAVLGTGLYLGKLAGDDAQAVEDRQGMEWGVDEVDLEARGQMRARYALASTVAGVVAIVGGGALYFLGRRAGDQPAVTVAPERGGAQVVWSCAF